MRRLRLIPKFNGESFQELEDFIDICETLYYSCISPAESNEFYEQMMLQLRGEPRLFVSSMESLEWDDIKEGLLEKYAHLSNKILISSQIENMRQEKDESLSTYAERARKLLITKNLTYTYLNDEQKAEHDRTARKAFVKGIKNSQLRRTMQIRGSS